MNGLVHCNIYFIPQCEKNEKARIANQGDFFQFFRARASGIIEDNGKPETIRPASLPPVLP
jgi:hypothetical protein